MIKTGDKITFAALTAAVETRYRIVRGTVRMLDNHKERFHAVDEMDKNFTHYLNGEGTYWIQGHHASESPAMRALMVTAALATGAVIE